jgi:glucose-1-phosphate thymidylyltransferase
MFRTGEHLGLKISYVIQEAPRGLPEAFLLSEGFLNKTPYCMLILGDNIFNGNIPIVWEPQIFAYKVKNPSDYGVVEFDKEWKVISLEEKPKVPKSKYAVPGLYKLDDNVVDFCKTLKPSARGELEITDLLNMYIKENGLTTSVLPEGFVWLDAGTPSMLYQSAAYVQTVQERTGKKIGCIEEDCYKAGYIDRDRFIKVITNIPKGEYRQYLEELL